MIPELESIIQDLEAAMKGPSPERALPGLMMRALRELQRVRDQQQAVESDTHQHMWNAIHKIAASNNVEI